MFVFCVILEKMPRQQSKGTETNLKNQVMRMLAKEYPAAIVRKRHGTVYATKGDPDLSILIRGIHLECELKRLGESPTPLQAVRLETWRQAGAQVAVIHTVAEMREFMDTIPYSSLPCSFPGPATSPRSPTGAG